MTFNAPGSISFPVGKGGSYRPVLFQYTGLTGTSIVSAEQFETPLTGTLPAYTSLLTTGRHWTITQSGGTGLQYFVTLDASGYTPSGTIVMLKKDAAIVSCPAVAAASLYTNVAAFTSFSDFALGQLTCLLSTGPAPKVADLVVTGQPGAVIRWYDAASGGNLLAGTTLLVSHTDYWASQEVNGCESSARFRVTAIVNDCYITVATGAAGSITATSATCGGIISNNCGGNVTASGVCWATATGPIATGNHTTDGTSSGTFTSSITGLTPGTTYYVRAYATNSSGTAYGNEVNFTTP